MWHVMRRAGWDVGRDQVARLMNITGLHGVRRGPKPITTRRGAGADQRPDLGQRRFVADRPQQLWVADITYARILTGFYYVAFITDVFSRRIVGWAVAPRSTRSHYQCSRWSTPLFPPGRVGTGAD